MILELKKVKRVNIKKLYEKHVFIFEKESKTKTLKLTIIYSIEFELCFEGELQDIIKRTLFSPFLL